MSVSEEKKKVWDAQEAIFERIYASGFQDYAKRLGGLSKAFNEKMYLRCIDEGTPGGIHLAGSGLLFEKDLLPKNVKGIFTHQGCGAAKLYAQTHKLDKEHPDVHYIWWVKEFAREADIPYLGHICSREFAGKIRKGEQLESIISGRGAVEAAMVSNKETIDRLKRAKKIDPVLNEKELCEVLDLPGAGQITNKECVTELKRPEGFHIARVTYYDGTGKFNPECAKGLPPGFIISRRHTNEEYAGKELGISISIAFGDHGFGKLITKEAPFIICPVGNKKEIRFSLERLAKELRQIVGKDSNIRDHFAVGRIRIDGFSAPV